MSSNPPWLVAAGDTAAREYAETLGLPVVDTRPDHGFFLVRADNGLTLYHANAGEHDPGLRLSFIDGSIERRRASGRNSPLARALGLRRHPNSRVLDTTCGLGRDSATLAALGCRVSALERHPVLFALVDDALARAIEYEPAPAWLEFWSCLEHADARAWLGKCAPALFDVIYIDPMFASPRRKARPQKALEWLNALVGVDSDASELLRVARNHALRQTVVKQHARAEALALPRPSGDRKINTFRHLFKLEEVIGFRRGEPRIELERARALLHFNPSKRIQFSDLTVIIKASRNQLQNA